MGINLRRPGLNWAQLTYTSADANTADRGGWGVKETSLSAPEDALAALRQRVTTRIAQVEETSRFPSDDELALRPRRLLSSEVGGRSCLWHAVNAGQDATGRPGNVFTHAAALLSSDRLLRPIEYWRSPGWLTPFGAIDVNAARLGELEPGSAVTRADVLRFIEPFERSVALEWLLSAFAHARDAGVLVALAASKPDEVAMWLGALSFLTTPSCARTFNWVTYERAANIDDLRRHGMHIVGVPRVDVDALTALGRSDVIVLDPDWAVAADQLRDGYWTVGGQRFPASPWQTAMTDLLGLDPDALARVLTRIDVIDAELADVPTPSIPLHLPLSLALLEEPTTYPANLRAERLVDCFRSAGSEELWGQTVMWSLVAADVPDDVWAELNQLPGFESLDRRISEVNHAHFYLSEGWLSQEPPVDLVQIDQIRRVLYAEMKVVVSRALGIGELRGDDVLAVARLVTFVSQVWGNEPIADLLPVVRAAIVNAGLTQADLTNVRHDLSGQVLAAEARPESVSSGSWDVTDAPSHKTGAAAPVAEPATRGEIAPGTMQDRPLSLREMAAARSKEPLSGAGHGAGDDPERHWAPAARVTQFASDAVEDAPEVARPVPDDVFGFKLPGALMSALVQLYDDAYLGRDAVRADALADAIMVTLGLRELPLRSLSGAADTDLRLVWRLLEEPSSIEFPPRSQSLLWGWCAVYFALADLELKPIDEIAMRQALALHEEAMLAGLARYVRSCDDIQLRAFVRISVMRALHNPKFLGLLVSTGPIGISAIRAATPDLPPGLLDRVVTGLRPLMTRDAGNGAGRHLDDISPTPVSEVSGRLRSGSNKNRK